MNIDLWKKFNEEHNYVGDCNLFEGGIFLNLDDWKDGYVTALEIIPGCEGQIYLSYVVLNLDNFDANDIETVIEQCPDAYENIVDYEDLNDYNDIPENSRSSFVYDSLQYGLHVDPDMYWSGRYTGINQFLFVLDPDYYYDGYNNLNNVDYTFFQEIDSEDFYQFLLDNGYLKNF